MSVMIKVDNDSKTIDVYGGESGCTEDDPYWIPFDRVWESWIAHMSGKNWMESGDLYRLESELNEIRMTSSLQPAKPGNR